MCRIYTQYFNKLFPVINGMRERFCKNKILYIFTLNHQQNIPLDLIFDGMYRYFAMHFDLIVCLSSILFKLNNLT